MFFVFIPYDRGKRTGFREINGNERLIIEEKFLNLHQIQDSLCCGAIWISYKSLKFKQIRLKPKET